jgi:hypothetical protein
MLASGVCYTVSRAAGGCVDPILGLGTVLETYPPRGDDEDGCSDCGVTCWKQCGTSTYIRTYSAEVLEYAHAGVALKRAEDGFCYEYEPSLGTCGTPAIVPFTVEDVFEAGLDSCAVCLDPKYKLTPDCGGCDECGGEGSGSPISGTASMVISEADAPEMIKAAAKLNDGAGGFVKRDGICYRVTFTTETLSDPVPAMDCLTGPYESCALCAEGQTILTLVVYRDGEITGLRVLGPFKACGTVDVTIPCAPPAP